MAPRQSGAHSEGGAIRRATQAVTVSAEVTGGYLAYLAQSLFLDSSARKTKLEAVHRDTARRMTDKMLELRGPIMKLGQTLSLHGDVLPAATLAELSRLQMRAPGMHPSLVRAQFRASMKRDPEELFTTFDPVPFAAASLGQVHRATLPSGETVAVKIQYPGIRDAIEADFKWFRAVALPARVSKHLPPAIIDELQQQISAETDYKREAANLKVFTEGLASLGFVEIPRVYGAYSSDRVLTMSLVPGVHLDALLATNPSQQVRDRLGARLFELFYFQLLRMQTIHADPHWGNYLFREDGGIGLVDFGCVKYLPSGFVTSFRKMFFYNGNYQSDEFRQLIEAHYAAPGTSLSSAVRCALAGLSERFYRQVYPPEPQSPPPFDFADASFLQDYMQAAAKLARAKGIRAEYVFLSRAEIGLYQTLHRLGAHVDTSRIVRQYLQPAQQ